MRRAASTLFIISLATAFSFSQGTIPMNKREFREKFTQANLEMMEHFYDTALTTFLYIRQMDTSNANINYKLGIIYLETHTKKHYAQRYLEAAVNGVSRKYVADEPNERRCPELAYFYLAKALHINNNFQRSIDYFDKFRDLPGKKSKEIISEIEHYKEMCFTALELMKNPVNCTIKSLGDSVNSPYGDYSPVISVDEDVLMFTSNRKGTGGDNNITPEGNYFEDIWICYRKTDGSWTQAKSIGPTINTFDNEATIGLSADAQQLFIYKDDNGDGNIYRSELNGDIWSRPEKMGTDNVPETDINTGAFEPSACISADGNMLYIVSNRPGGYGGTDIYRVLRLPNGNWSMAQNLGPTINTMYDEDAPFIHPDGKTLFFSSKGQRTMGGYDIFYSIKFDSGWSAPKNLGYPINTADDDIFYTTSADGKRAYYSSIRPGGLGDEDIYEVQLEDALSGSVVVLKGKITFDGKDILPPGAVIHIRDNATGEQLPEIKPNPVSGKYIIVLTPGSSDSKTYTVSYEADSLDPIVETIKVERKAIYSETEKAIEIHDIDFKVKRLGTMSISGIVKGTDGFFPDTRINISDNSNGALLSTYFANKDGNYTFVIERGKNYNISFEADGYLFQSININVPMKAEYSEIKKDILLDKIAIGVKITLNNIFFDSGKSLLRKESGIEMEKVILLMKQHPEVRIEVSGHTDNKGNDKVNQKLSQDRAQSVVNYIIKNGIDKKRLIAKGYGKTQPVVPNNRPDGSPDPEGMQLNRRVEMKIIE